MKLKLSNSRMTTAIMFSRQNDAGLTRAHYLVLTNPIFVVVLVLESKVLYYSSLILFRAHVVLLWFYLCFHIQGYIWEQWHALIEPYATIMPYMVGIGNHEQDHNSGGSKDPSGAPGEGWHPWWGNFGDDSGGECGVPMYYRFHMPDNGNALWWWGC